MEVCEERNMPDSTLRKWVVTELEPVKRAGHRLYWRREEVEALIQRKIILRSNYGQGLTRDMLPTHPDELFYEWLSITATWSSEWNSDWGRHLRKELKRLGFKPLKVDTMTVRWG